MLVDFESIYNHVDLSIITPSIRQSYQEYKINGVCFGLTEHDKKNMWIQTITKAFYWFYRRKMVNLPSETSVWMKISNQPIKLKFWLHNNIIKYYIFNHTLALFFNVASHFCVYFCEYFIIESTAKWRIIVKTGE